MENSCDCNIPKRPQQSSLRSYFDGVFYMWAECFVFQSHGAQIICCCSSVTDIFAQLPQRGGTCKLCYMLFTGQ